MESGTSLPKLLAALVLLAASPPRFDLEKLISAAATPQPGSWQHAGIRMAALLRQVAAIDYSVEDIAPEASTEVARLFDEAAKILEWMMNTNADGNAWLFSETLVLRHHLHQGNRWSSPVQLAEAWDGLVAGTWPEEAPATVSGAELEIDHRERLVRWAGRRLQINKKREFMCICLLAENNNVRVSYESICRHVLDRPVRSNAATTAVGEIRGEISRIRRALKCAGCPCSIGNVPKVAYVFSCQPGVRIVFIDEHGTSTRHIVQSQD